MAPMREKVIAVTGAASGIGHATAKVLAARGAFLSLADLNSKALDEIVAYIKSSGGRCIGTQCDVRDRQQVHKFIQATIEEYGRLDGAANLAGVIGKHINIHQIHELANDEWDFVMGVNSTGVFNCLAEELSIMADGGSIVNAASIAGLIGFEKNCAYVASKHAVVGLTRSAAKEYGARNIRVNAIAPGTINTPMVRQADTGPVKSSELAVGTAIRREGQPEEVARLIAFLLSDETTFISGSVYSIDGGWAC